jgi:predicted HicB family RNase H-like nuclease
MKIERIGLRITKELKDNLKYMAEKDNRSLSNYIEKILKNHVQKVNL